MASESKTDIYETTAPTGRNTLFKVTRIIVDGARYFVISKVDEEGAVKVNNQLGYFIAQLRRLADIDLVNDKIISCSPGQNEFSDYSYTLVIFNQTPKAEHFLSRLIHQHKELGFTCSSTSIPASDVMALSESGVVESKYMGKTITIRTLDRGDVTGLVQDYNGESYIIHGISTRIKGRVIGVKAE